MKAVVLTFDELSLSFLGCYGNEWIETPHFDRLAARSVVFDQHFGENFGSEAANHAWWTGCYQFLRPSNKQQRQENFFDLLNEQGVSTHLFREQADQQASETIPFPAEFKPVDRCDGPDIEHTETSIAKLIQRAETSLEQLADKPNEPSLLWLKSLGIPEMLQLPPEPFGSLYLDELEETSDGGEGGEPAEATENQNDERKSIKLTDEPEPERMPELTETDWQQYRLVYAGYVSLLDWWLGQLLDAIEKTSTNEQLLLIVTAATGGYNGEREWLESNRDQETTPQTILREEIIHTPLLVACSDGTSPGSRRQSLVQTVDIMPTLLDWFEIETGYHPCEGLSLLPTLRDEEIVERDYLCLGEGIGLSESLEGSPYHRTSAIRTNDLYLIHHGSSRQSEADESADDSHADQPSQLFVKPDDIWEVHDVAAQAPAEVKCLAATLQQFIQNAQMQRPLEIPELVEPKKTS